MAVEVSDGRRQANGSVAVRNPWHKTLRLARLAADRYKQKPTSHVESWYGFHTAFEAARIMPDPAIDSVLNSRFDLIIDKVSIVQQDGRTNMSIAYRMFHRPSACLPTDIWPMVMRPILIWASASRPI